jgi:hypothetical protein
MSDKFKLPEGLTFDDGEDIIEEVPKEIEDGWNYS